MDLTFPTFLREILSQGSRSQILYLGPSFYYVSKIGLLNNMNTYSKFGIVMTHNRYVHVQ